MGAEPRQQRIKDPEPDGWMVDALRRLEIAARRLTLRGWGLSALLSAQVVLTLLVSTLGVTSSASRWLSVGLSLGVVALAYLFDYARKEGDGLFSEISDRFQETRVAPGDARDRMRQFTRASQLPLLAGPTGAFLYVVASVAMTAWLSFLSTR